MSQNIYILSDPETVDVANNLHKRIISNGIFQSKNFELTAEVLTNMAKICPTEYFYVISSDTELLFTNFDFSFKPPSWDARYMHVWNNNSRVRLLNTALVLKNPNAFTDKALQEGSVELKNIDQEIYEHPIFDIIFLSYDEFDADKNYELLKNRFSRTKRVHGIKGIKEAHFAAAKAAESSMFYVVDADAEVLEDFEFNHSPNYYDSGSVHIWHSRNPVNGLEYGYGGIKLFPTHSVLSYTGSPVDFTTSVARGVKVIPEVANITHFNTDPFSTWRSAFRECVKLSTGIINGQLSKETESRLHAWCTIGNGEYGDFSVEGANEGLAFGKAHNDQPDMLRLINDFSWLEKKFNS